MHRRPAVETERVHPASVGLQARGARDIVDVFVADHRAALAAFSPRVRWALAALAGRFARSLDQGGRVVYVGAGTSGRLGALDAAECPPTFGTSPSQVVALVAGGRRALARSVEGAEDRVGDARAGIDRLAVGPQDLVIGIAASSSTPFVLAALARARARGARTALVSCRKPEPASRADQTIVLSVGPEIVAGSTRLKAGTATKVALNAVSTTAMILLGRVLEGRMVALRGTNAKLKRRAVAIVRDFTGLGERPARALLARHAWSVRRALEARAPIPPASPGRHLWRGRKPSIAR